MVNLFISENQQRTRSMTGASGVGARSTTRLIMGGGVGARTTSRGHRVSRVITRPRYS